ncbi:hypothetical protein ACJIZ3_021445 [Penstemon smallii]|uniref:Uncharacterized protein n=1 Tax=Penstemon smallii TaxID=265156 RepID=A0ABD3SM24_9LAMI
MVLVKEAVSEGCKPTDTTQYGGGAFSILGDTIVLSNYKDQRLYKQSSSSTVSKSHKIIIIPSYIFIIRALNTAPCAVLYPPSIYIYIWRLNLNST